jgi:hypothetical protein
MQVWVRVNRPPSNGNCSVTPRKGVALTTSFNLACNNWIDAEGQYPLSYSFTAYRSGRYVMSDTYAKSARAYLRVTLTLSWRLVQDKQQH